MSVLRACPFGCLNDKRPDRRYGDLQEHLKRKHAGEYLPPSALVGMPSCPSCGLVLRKASGLLRHQTSSSCTNRMRMRETQRYLRGTADRGLSYPRGSSSGKLAVYSDADHGGDQETAKSTTGVVVQFNSSTVAWLSRRQGVVALSTLEAEYIALHDATKEAAWFRRLLGGLGQQLLTATEIHCDNQGAIAFSVDPKFHNRTKHINIKYHYVRQEVEAGATAIVYTATDQQKADVLTKGLLGTKHGKASKSLNMS